MITQIQRTDKSTMPGLFSYPARLCLTAFTVPSDVLYLRWFFGAWSRPNKDHAIRSVCPANANIIERNVTKDRVNESYSILRAKEVDE